MYRESRQALGRKSGGSRGGTILGEAVTAALVCCVMMGSVSARAAEAKGAWKAGLATVVTTPESSMWMAGYAARNKPSEGKVQDLHAKALALEDAQGTRFVIVTVDIIGFSRDWRDAVVKEVGTRHGLRPEALLLNASHTHSGPEIRAWRATQLWDLPPEQIELCQKYADTLHGQIVDLVGRALQDLSPAQLSYVHGRAAAAMNRRSQTAQGYTIFSNADGPVDHDVPVLVVSTPEGKGTPNATDNIGDPRKMRALLFGYACHNTTLDFYQFCGDYAGYAQEYIEETHPGAVALFMIGCGGDQNPTPRRTLEWAKQHGRAVANGVEQGLATKPRPVRGPLRLALGEATLELSAPPSVEELKQEATSANKYQSRHAQELLKNVEAGQTRSTYPYLVQVARFGDDLTMVGLAGEVVVDYSLRLKKELAAPTSSGPSPAIWVAGYCNEVFGYVPSQRVLQEGGYEARESVLYYDVTKTPFAPSIEKLIVDKVHELVRETKGGK
jgi:neutral ceramidase